MYLVDRTNTYTNVTAYSDTDTDTDTVTDTAAITIRWIYDTEIHNDRVCKNNAITDDYMHTHTHNHDYANTTL